MRWIPWLLCIGCGPGAHPDEPPDADAAPLRAAFLADPHVIDLDDYECCEGSDLDTQSIYRTQQRLQTTRDLINDIQPPVDRVFILGDIFHQNYKYGEDLAAYKAESAAAAAAGILQGFNAPVELLWGNHDYDVPEISREFSASLFREIFQTEPYHAVDMAGFKFLLTNSQLGATWDASDPMNMFLNTQMGSFGREQLAWIEAQLQEGKPTFLMFHHGLFLIAEGEDPDGVVPDLHHLIDAYADTIAGIYVGHTHRWIELDAGADVPAFILGAVRYDADNYWVHEFQPDGSDFKILDYDKASWGTAYGYGSDFDENGEVVLDFTTPAEDDPAGPWEE